MSKEALTILHQHKIQGEMSSLQNAIAHWIAFSRLHQEPGKSLDYKLLLSKLKNVEAEWDTSPLTREEVRVTLLHIYFRGIIQRRTIIMYSYDGYKFLHIICMQYKGQLLAFMMHIRADANPCRFGSTYISCSEL
jgi:hypothetical protein